MFNFWPFNIARKRREAEAKDLQEFRDSCKRLAEIKRNKVIPLDHPLHPRNQTPEQRAKVKASERASKLEAVLERKLQPAQRPMASRNFGAPYGTSTPADDIASNLLHPMNPLNTLGIYGSGAASGIDESNHRNTACDAPSSYDSSSDSSSSCDSSSSSSSDLKVRS